jgi:uncharacterized protein YggE
MFALKVRTAFAALLAGAAMFPATAQVPYPHAPIGIGDTATIQTSASREVRIAPDRATLILAVETRAPSAGAAAQANARAQRAVLDTLRTIGIAPSQIGTAGFTVQEAYESNGKGGMQRTGFVANNAITVRLTQLDRVGAVIDAALAKGATNVNDLTFDASNTADARRAALADAAAQAKSDAQVLAKAMGGTLGPLIWVTTEEENTPPRPMIRAMAPAGSETPIVAGDISVSASVQAKWAFIAKPE